uniref:Uncharacterized protein n=1 Tax=Xiphophorus couchianus TaxID=32473 RepID=A0A3B5L510_9TELE
ARSLHLRRAAARISARCYSSRTASSADYLHQSVVPSMHYQKSLPR